MATDGKASNGGEGKIRHAWRPKEGERGPLDSSGMCFGGGVLMDLKRRAPYYASDWTDAFKPEHFQKTLATTLFLFFACLAPAIAFGTLFDEGTNRSFGVVEMIMSSALSGIVYSIFAGQPLCILGATGPVLAYTVIFYNMCQGLGLEFLTCYFWVGIWFSAFTVLAAIFEVCCIMHHVTKFTEEIFSGLISLIFIVEAVKPTVKAFWAKDLEAAFLQVLLMLGTYILARSLAGLKNTNLLNFTMRKMLSNFAVSIAILAVSGIAAVWDHVDIDMLVVPSELRPTWTNQETQHARPWVVSPFGTNGDFPVWGIFWCILPAMGFAVLGFLDQNLTTLLVNRPTNKLQKPPAYHLDLLVCGVLIYPVCAVFGLPFPVAATVRSLTHLISLTDYDVQEIKGGGHRKVPGNVVEQRVTNLSIHVLIGLSLALAPWLRYLPKSVLYGVFLFMGVSSLNGNELFERLALWTIWDPKRYPQYRCVELVPTKRLHTFTALQALGLAILYALKSIQEVAVAFPFFIAFLAVIRPAFGYYFSKEELEILDGEEDEVDDVAGSAATNTVADPEVPPVDTAVTNTPDAVADPEVLPAEP